ncbi:carboxymuconolactone decarboxylase family protein [Novosphingobium flavum]|nr:hypothetical protein [Novosphingobium flavum]
MRFKSSLPERLREFSLLIAARFWDAQDSWNAHLGKAHAAGLPEAVTQALAERREPPFEAEDEAVFYRFCKELLETHLVSDETYAKAQALFGDEGMVDAVACLGTFSMLAMVLNTFQVDLDPAKRPFADMQDYTRTAPRAPLG